MPNPPISPSQPVVDTAYVAPDGQGPAQSWLLPPGAVYGGPTPAQPLALPYLFSGQGSPTDLDYANDDFLLKTSFSGSPTRGSVTVGLSLTGRNAWATAAPARAALRANYLDFLINVEKRGLLGQTPLLVAGALPVITTAVTQLVPMPLSEALFFACGLDTGIGTGARPSVDVLAGMRLRREPSSRQYVGAPSQAFSGYQATGTLGWTVATGRSADGAPQSFDAFLGIMASPQITPPPATAAPLCNLYDLQLAGSRHRFHRLLFPQAIAPAAAAGSWSGDENVVLVGGDTLADVRSPTPPYARPVFGRDVVVPEICIWLGLSGGMPRPEYVPLGTTLANVLERFTRWRPLAAADGGRALAVWRSGYGVTGGLRTLSIVLSPVRQGPTDPWFDLAALELPLWPGDAVQLQLAIPAGGGG